MKLRRNDLLELNRRSAPSLGAQEQLGALFARAAVSSGGRSANHEGLHESTQAYRGFCQLGFGVFVDSELGLALEAGAGLAPSVVAVTFFRQTGVLVIHARDDSAPDSAEPWSDE